MAAPVIDLDFLRPPAPGWTAQDLDRIPNLPDHTELLDGGFFFQAPQSAFHRRMIDLLTSELAGQAPPGHRAIREMAVRLDPRNSPEPDVAIVCPGATEDDTTWYPASAVLLAIEVVAPDSVERDELLKPVKYARAGIAHYWRIDRDEQGSPVCCTYELDPATGAYQPAGVFHGKVEATRPFPVTIDLAAR